MPFSVLLILGPSLFDGVLRVLLIIEFTTDLGKSFHEANLLMILISDENLFGAQIRYAGVTRVLGSFEEIGDIYFLMESAFIIYIHYYENRSFLVEIFI